MKRSLPIMFLIAANFVFAQNHTSGIYKSSEDYKEGKFINEINCNSSSDKIKLNHFLTKNYIVIVKGKNEIRLNKDSVFGYRDCKQNEYRFYKNYNHEYKIVENKNIVIYIADMPVPTSDGRRTQLVPTYFFSINLQEEILPLTATNLKKAFPQNIKMHSLLDLEFFEGKNISTYDDIHKMYKVNFLLSQTISH